MLSLGIVGLLSVLPSFAAGARTGPQCEPIPGAEILLREGVVVLLGEIHGTKQAPEAVARLTCEALTRGLMVTVGLEIPRTEQDVTDRFLASDGTAEDEKLLLASDWWQRDYQDGRSSEAMFDLVRALRASGANKEDLSILLIDDPNSAEGRDLAMADLLSAEIDRRPQDLYVVLTGNLHNRLVAGRFEPMGYHLRGQKPGTEVISLNITYSGGTAWVCTTDSCGVVRLRGEAGIGPGVELGPESAENAYSGRLHVGEITASPPARDR
jgi:hypothetical protein